MHFLPSGELWQHGGQEASRGDRNVIPKELCVQTVEGRLRVRNRTDKRSRRSKCQSLIRKASHNILSSHSDEPGSKPTQRSYRRPEACFGCLACRADFCRLDRGISRSWLSSGAVAFPVATARSVGKSCFRMNADK